MSSVHTMIVANLAQNATPIDIKQLFKYLTDDISNVRIRTIKQPHTKQVKYMALLDFADKLTGDIAMSKLDGSPHWPAMPGECIDMYCADKFVIGFTLKVTNLPLDISDDDLLAFFSTVTAPKNIEIDADGGGMMRTECWAFVEFEEKSSAQKVITLLNGKNLGNRVLYIDWAEQENVAH